MEEQKNNQIFMLSDTLTENFNQEQWRIISSQTPQVFLKKQQSILNRLLDQKDMFQKYFHNFYSNHIKLLDWSLLAGQLKSQINPYIFRTLVSKGSNFFNKKIKQVFEIKLKRKKKEKQQQINKQQIKQMEQQVYKQFFNDMVARTTPDNSQKYNNLKGLLNKKQTDKMDGHQFYIKTFNACNGWKYIFYNYQKHMKGLSQKFKYNQKIRSNQHKYLFYSKSQDNLHLLQYQHDNLIKVETKVHHINQIIKDKKLNTMFGFKSLAKNSRKRKIFFQNHQGKPITYRVSRQ